MLNRRALKKTAREQILKNKTTILFMSFFRSAIKKHTIDDFIDIDTFTYFLPKKTAITLLLLFILPIVLLAAFNKHLPTPIIILLVAIIVIYILSIRNMFRMVGSAVYLEMAKSQESVELSIIKQKIEDLWFVGLIAGWVLFAKTYFILPLAAIRQIEYSQTHFIIAENPTIGIKNAMKLSKKITNGHKAELALLKASFFGWYLLIPLTAGLILFYLIPYMKLTFANAYLTLKEE